MIKQISSLVIIIIFLNACGGSEVPMPKPPIYPRIDYPKKNYKPITENGPFSFEIPQYATLKTDNERGGESYWYNIDYAPFDATLHLSYYPVNSLSELDSLTEDTRKLAYKHAFKADEITGIELSKTDDKVYGIMYLIDGNTATNLNFYLTDSTHHFLRGALYFNQKTKTDSIAPVFQFLKQDIEQMIGTMKWKP